MAVELAQHRPRGSDGVEQTRHGGTKQSVRETAAEPSLRCNVYRIFLVN